MRWLVRLEEDVDRETFVDAETLRGAAEEAVEYFYESGEWAGEEMPKLVRVLVRKNGEPITMETDVTVVTDWRPTFTAVST